MRTTIQILYFKVSISTISSLLSFKSNAAQHLDKYANSV